MAGWWQRTQGRNTRRRSIPVIKLGSHRLLLIWQGVRQKGASTDRCQTPEGGVTVNRTRAAGGMMLWLVEAPRRPNLPVGRDQAKDHDGLTGAPPVGTIQSG